MRNNRRTAIFFLGLVSIVSASAPEDADRRRILLYLSRSRLVHEGNWHCVPDFNIIV